MLDFNRHLRDNSLMSKTIEIDVEMGLMKI